MKRTHDQARQRARGPDRRHGPPSGAAPDVPATAPEAAGRFGISRELWVVLLLALGLRVWHLGEGLPDFFEEAFPFRRAFEMAGWEVGRVTWNPYAFHYPSLSFYVHMAAQGLFYLVGLLIGDYRSPADFFVAFHVNPVPMVLAARAIGVVADLAVVLAVARIGERMRRGAGLLAALLVALSSTLVRESRLIVTDGLMAALAVWSLERMIAYRAHRRWPALALAALLAGLAAGVKYPALLLVVPLGWATLGGGTRRAAARFALAWIGSLVVFVATSPYLAVEAAKAGYDLLRIANQVGEGQLGTFGGSSALYYLKTFTGDFGWLAPPALLGSLLLLRADTRAPRFLRGVWLFLLGFAVPMVLGRVEFERYLVPVIPVAALLMAVAALALPGLATRLAGAAGDRARALLVLLVAAPAVWQGFHAASLGGDTTQSQARRFVVARAGQEELVVQETHAAPLTDRWEYLRVTSSPSFARADSTWRARYLARPVTRAVRIPLLVAGEASVVAPTPEGTNREIRLFASSADLNRVFYEPALYPGVDWVLTSDAVRGRYQADPSRFAAANHFYHLLESTAESTATFRSGGTVTGPEIRAYRIGERFRAAVASAGPLDRFWWTRDVPAGARAELEEAMRRLGDAPRVADAPPLWILGLGAVFDRQIEPFVYALTRELHDLGRCDAAVPLGDAILAMSPGHFQATGIVASCAESQGEPGRARDAIARLLAACDPSDPAVPDIRLEYARLLAQTGARDEARRQLERVLSAPLMTGDTQRRANALLQELGRASSP